MARRLSHLIPLAVPALLSAAHTVQSFACPAFFPLHHSASYHARCSRSFVGVDRGNSAPVLHATSITVSSWKPCAQPRFDEFASCTVGPWITTSTSSAEDAASPVQEEVEEVMRSCGGAIQGIRELPLSMIFSTTDEGGTSEEERMYHNRADGGFVYADDGSYSAGPEHWDWSDVSDDESKKLLMASLAFPDRRRMWLTVKLSEASENIVKCRSEEQSDMHQKITINTKVLELSRPISTSLDISVRGNDHSGDTTESLTSSSSQQLTNTINWKEIQRVRMPNSNQSWSLARAKWEKQVVETTDEASSSKEDDDEMKVVSNNEQIMGPLMGWSYIESISSSGDQDEVNILIGDAIATDTINLHMLAVCTISEVARSVVRCYDASDGSLKSVAFLYGSLSNTNEQS